MEIGRYYQPYSCVSDRNPFCALAFDGRPLLRLGLDGYGSGRLFQRPVNFGGRFSKNASTPSRKSSLVRSRP